jgi:hypothetical protein
MALNIRALKLMEKEMDMVNFIIRMEEDTKEIGWIIKCMDKGPYFIKAEDLLIQGHGNMINFLGRVY